MFEETPRSERSKPVVEIFNIACISLAAWQCHLIIVSEIYSWRSSDATTLHSANILAHKLTSQTINASVWSRNKITQRCLLHFIACNQPRENIYSQIMRNTSSLHRVCDETKQQKLCVGKYLYGANQTF